MDIKLKYRTWVGEKHADISSPLNCWQYEGLPT